MQPITKPAPQTQTAAPDPIAGGCYTRDPRTGALTAVQHDPDAPTAKPVDQPKNPQE